MSRTNAGRRRHEERWAARRIAYEQRKRGWTNAQLALEMRKVGCALDQSAIHKIYKGQPKPRGISANELASFSEVLAVPVAELLKPLDLALADEANELLERLRERGNTLRTAAEDVAETIRQVLVLTGSSGLLTPGLMDAAVKQETAMINLIDLALVAEAALRGDDPADYPDEFE